MEEQDKIQAWVITARALCIAIESKLSSLKTCLVTAERLLSQQGEPCSTESREKPSSSGEGNDGGKLQCQKCHIHYDCKEYCIYGGGPHIWQPISKAKGG